MNEILINLNELSQNNPYYIGVDNILKSYDHAKSTSKNITTMEAAYTKDQLSAAVHYIKSLHEEYPAIVHRVNQRKSRNKNNLAGDVSIFINGITPINCLACKVDYIHAAADNSNNNSVLCLLCNRYSHKPCYREENITPGLAFICTLCFKKNTSQESSDTSRIDFQNSPISSQDSVKPTAASSANQSPSTAQSPTSPHQSIASPTLATPPLSRTQSTPRAIPPVTLSPQQTQSQSATQSDSQDDRHDDSISSEDSMLNPYQTPKQSSNSQDEEEKSKDFCQLYIEGICPHGISGKGCSSTHPKRCNKYSRHGEDKYRGCRRGDRCYYFHPRLCRNSTEMRVCLAKTCKDVHLVGTQRFKPKANYYREEPQHNYSSSQSRHYRYQDNQSSNWLQSQGSSNNSTNEAERSQHFLIQYLEKMRADLTKSMERKIESALQYRAEAKDNPHPISQTETPQPDIQNPYQSQTQVNPAQTLTSVGLVPTQHQFQTQHQPLNLSQPLQIQTHTPLLQMYQ